MIRRTYHVFGSGCAGMQFRQLSDDLGQLVEFLRRTESVTTDDGHNGFIGTESVPDELAAEFGVVSHKWASPGALSKKGPEWISAHVARVFAGGGYTSVLAASAASSEEWMRCLMLVEPKTGAAK